MNKVILIGRLARDPEVRSTPSGKVVARMTIAVDRRMSRNASAEQQTADFIPLVAWERLAEICGNNLKKGRRISVEGRLQVRSYEAQDGSKRYATEVVVSDIEFLDPRSQESSNMDSYGQSSSSVATFGSPSMVDDIPF